MKIIYRSYHGYASPRLRVSKYLNFDPSDRLSLGYNLSRKRTRLSRINKRYTKEMVLSRINKSSLLGSFKDPEKRLDVNLWRSTLADTRLIASRLITGGFIYVNHKQIKHPSYKLKSGDLVNMVKEVLPLFSSSTPRDISMDIKGVFNIKEQKVGTPDYNNNRNSRYSDPYPLHLRVDSPSFSFIYIYDAEVLPRVVSIKV